MKAKKLSKGKYSQACMARFEEWKNAGNAPKTRESALKIIRHATGKTLAQVKQGLSFADAEGIETVNTRIAMAVWDLTENDGKAFDYSDDNNWFNGLLQQIGNFILTYTRIQPVRPAGVKSFGTDPTYISLPGRGLVPIVSLTPKQFETHVDAAINEAKQKLIRWKALGASRPALLKKLTALSVAVVGEYEASVA